MNTPKPRTTRRQKITGAAVLLVLLLVGVLLFFRVGRPMLRLVQEPEFFRTWVQEKGNWGRLAYAGMVILQVLVALIPGEPLEIAGGYAFGAFEGTLLCLLAAAVGSIIVFGLVRRFGVKLAELFFPRERLRSLRFLQSNRRRTLLFLIVFTMPGTPKDLLCYFAGLTDMKLSSWLVICSLGRLPSIISSTVGGDALGSRNHIFAIVIFAATLAVSGAGLLFFNWIQRRNTALDKEDEP